MIRFRSIISRIVAFHIVAIGATSVLMPLALYYLLNEAANSLHPFARVVDRDRNRKAGGREAVPAGVVVAVPQVDRQCHAQRVGRGAVTIVIAAHATEHGRDERVVDAAFRGLRGALEVVERHVEHFEVPAQTPVAHDR